MRPLLLDLQRQGLSNLKIADAMNRQGHRTLRRHRWSSDIVRQTLAQPVE